MNDSSIDFNYPLYLDSTRLAGCITNHGCNTTTNPSFTPSILPANGLLVESDNDCVKLLQSHWSFIIVKEGLCNSVTNALSIINYPSLTFIDISANTFKSIPSFTVTNCNQLVSIRIFDGLSDLTSFDYATSISITGNNVFMSIIEIFQIFKRFILEIMLVKM